MAEILALEKLYSDVLARFTLDGTAVANVFGWRATDELIPSGARIAWVPGDPRGGVGETGPARNPGRNPRSVATLRELFHVVISASDPSDPENEAKQYHTVRLLRDAWLRAVHLASYGTYRITAEEWLTDKKVRRRGAALRVTCTIEAMVPDAPKEIAPADVGADISVVLTDGLHDSDAESGPIIIGGEDEQEISTGGAVGAGATYTADEDLSALRVVRFSDTPGHIVYARYPEAASAAPLGITVSAGLSGSDVQIITTGELKDDSFAWEVGRPVLLGADGTLTQSAPSNQPFIVAVGTAIAVDTLMVRIEPPIFFE